MSHENIRQGHQLIQNVPNQAHAHKRHENFLGKFYDKIEIVLKVNCTDWNSREPVERVEECMIDQPAHYKFVSDVIPLKRELYVPG